MKHRLSTARLLRTRNELGHSLHHGEAEVVEVRYE